MRLLDTDILIDVLRDYAPALQWLDSLDEAPAVPGLVVTELVQGCTNKSEVREVLQFTAPLAVIWPSQADCHFALQLFPTLRLRDGVGLLDMLIGTSAIASRATLCTFNVRHYRAVPGLVTEQPYEKRA